MPGPGARRRRGCRWSWRCARLHDTKSLRVVVEVEEVGVRKWVQRLWRRGAKGGAQGQGRVGGGDADGRGDVPRQRDTKNLRVGWLPLLWGVGQVGVELVVVVERDKGQMGAI